MANARRVAMVNQATITKTEARIFFNMGRARFRRRWDQYYRHRIKSVETEGGLRLLLIDVVKIAFPTASKAKVLDMALQYLLYVADKKAQARLNRIRAKVESEDGSQGQ